MDPRVHLPVSNKSSGAEMTPEILDQYRREFMQQLQEELGENFTLVNPLLEQFCLDGVLSISTLFLLANRQGKIPETIERIQLGLNEQWSQQHPQIRGHRDYSRNEGYLYGCYQDLGIKLTDNVFSTKLPENADEHLQRLRAVLEASLLEESCSIEKVLISEQEPGQLLIAVTKSGNRYLIEVIDPTTRKVNLMQLNVRSGSPPSGIIPDQYLKGVTVGHRLSTYGGVNSLTSSPLKAVYLL